MNFNPLYQTASGLYPQPFEVREIEAIKQVVSDSRERWQYFLQRYGDTGLFHHTRDLGYLTTLTTYQQGIVNQQVEWLAAVLASRGIPSYFLARSLEALDTALSEHKPVRAYAYVKLGRAAVMLDEKRRMIFSDAQLDAFQQSLQLSTEHHIAAPEAATLVMSAIADDQLAYGSCLANVMSWLADPHYFSPSWCATLASAGQSLRAAL